MSLKHLSPLGLLILAISLLLPVVASAAEGYAAVTNVQGDVTYKIASFSDQAYDGLVIKEGYEIVTGPAGSCLLVLSNGSTIQVNANSSMQFTQLQQNGFASASKFTKLRSEPGSSQTGIKLNYGEIVGNTKKLSRGSSYEIETPVGVAGIRGTTWGVTVIPLGNGFFDALVYISEGEVEFTPVGTATAQAIGEGTQVRFRTEQLPNGDVRVVASAPANISPNQRAIIQSFVNNLQVSIERLLAANPDLEIVSGEIEIDTGEEADVVVVPDDIGEIEITPSAGTSESGSSEEPSGE